MEEGGLGSLHHLVLLFLKGSAFQEVCLALTCTCKSPMSTALHETHHFTVTTLTHCHMYVYVEEEPLYVAYVWVY